MDPPVRGRRLRGWLAAAILALASAVGPHAGAQAQPTVVQAQPDVAQGGSQLTSIDVSPVTGGPTDPDAAEEWANSAVRSDEATSTLSLSLREAPPLTVTRGSRLSFALTITNNTDEPQSGAAIITRVAGALASVSDARAAAAADTTAYDLAFSTDEIGDLSAHESRDATATLDTSQLGAGTYPIAFQAGTDTERTLITVLDPQVEAGEQSALSLVLPITQDPHIVPGDTGEAPDDPPLVLTDDSLAAAVAPDGRLSALLDALDDATDAARAATCLAIDPATVSALNRMTTGYTLSQSRPRVDSQTRRLRDSWGSSDDDDLGAPGTGADDAATFLSRLSDAASSMCTVALPWSNADLDAVASINDDSLLADALISANDVLTEVLDAEPLTNVVLPSSGTITATTAEAIGRVAATQGADSSDPATVLLADNAVSVDDGAALGQLQPSLQAATYPAGLAAILATVGEYPATVGYSNPDYRFDYTTDSDLARAHTAGTALRIAVGENPDQPVVAVAPEGLDGPTAQELLSAAGTLLTSGSEGVSLPEAIAHSAPEDGTPAAQTTGAPFSDPGAVTAVETLVASQHNSLISQLTELTTEDSGIALTPEGFTAPLRRDILTAVGTDNRRSISGFTNAMKDALQRLSSSRNTVSQLRSSVNLVPPGNAFTRTSDSSPLLVVASNGLPLPVLVTIGSSNTDGVSINTPGTVRVPAHGSLTVQLTTTITDSSERATVDLWLASAQRGTPISDTVRLVVQTRTPGTKTIVLAIAIVILLATAFAVRIIRKRRKNAGDSVSVHRHKRQQ